jgi:glycosidase
LDRNLNANMNATLDLGRMRLIIRDVALGREPPSAYFGFYDTSKSPLAQFRTLGSKHVISLDDIDNVFGKKRRFAGEAGSEGPVIPAFALQLYTLGIPCIYYGTEQGLTGPPDSGDHIAFGDDIALRETMFSSPFGPFGRQGHCFNQDFPLYKKIAAMIEARQRNDALRYGRQYPRKCNVGGDVFSFPGAGGLAAWSRVLTNEEILCVVNFSRTESMAGRVVVESDRRVLGHQMQVILNTSQIGDSHSEYAHNQMGSKVVIEYSQGVASVKIEELSPGAVLLLKNVAAK